MTHERAKRLAAEWSFGGVCTMREGEAAEYHKLFYELLCQQEQERNDPLTLEELRKMTGDPVFVVTERIKEWCIVHSHHLDDVIGGGIIMTRRTAEKRLYAYADYGKTWMAYRRKPDEEEHDT